MSSCRHCAEPVAVGSEFCCPGCAAAFTTIHELGFGRYYQQRELESASRPLKPEESGDIDLAHYAVVDSGGIWELNLAVEGVQCGACIWLIESVLAREKLVELGRVNMTTRRLRLRWRGEMAGGLELVARIRGLGYRLVPYDPGRLAVAGDAVGRRLLRALAVAGFAAGNVMFMSIGIWAGEWQNSMTAETRNFLHLLSAIVAVPAVLYAGMPFFLSAWSVLRRGRTNMDVPISIGVSLVTLMSLVETLQGGPEVYFDSATVLLLFLLTGRYLDHIARGKIRATAEHLVMLRASSVGVIQPDGSVALRAPDAVGAGDRVLVGMGERVGVDGVVESGVSTLDASLVTGESLPVEVAPGSRIFAGTLNQGPAFTLTVTATGGATLLAECVRLIEAAELRRGRFVVLAERVARRYAPVVHVTALLTLLIWRFGLHASWHTALLDAAAVLIVTCPCALGLAVPAVQVIATGWLFRRGILAKNPTALERLALVDHVVFDKTGTLTEPHLVLAESGLDAADLYDAAALAAASRHPLARALAARAPGTVALAGVVESSGAGLSWGGIRLGSRNFCSVDSEKIAEGPELWLARPGREPVRFLFEERLRGEAGATLDGLRHLGIGVELLSGDRAEAVAAIAGKLDISIWQSNATPVLKVAHLEALAARGKRVLMVGDGLNDAPALAAASVSMSPSSGADISQNMADLVFQRGDLLPILEAVQGARRARRLILQNIGFAIGYNAIAVPLAICGLLTPWIAAAAMSSSSLLVIGNSFRLSRARGK